MGRVYGIEERGGDAGGGRVYISVAGSLSSYSISLIVLTIRSIYLSVHLSIYSICRKYEARARISRPPHNHYCRKHLIPSQRHTRAPLIPPIHPPPSNPGSCFRGSPLAPPSQMDTQHSPSQGWARRKGRGEVEDCRGIGLGEREEDG